MNKTVEEFKVALKGRLSKNIPEHSDCMLSAKFKDEISKALDTVMEYCDDDDLDGFIVFSALVELAIYEKSIGGLYDYLCNFES